MYTWFALAHGVVPGRRRRPPGARPVAPSPLAPACRPRLLLALRLCVLVCGLSQEVGRHQAADAVYLAEVEAVVVHVAVDVDDLTGGERQFLLQLG